ncbi:MAG: mechanosensitive ion channel family protein [Candidatus ainarchaeum sp.]|nr:mechanosensitive ion channel family protein [Candidatus ainarchaeum sp.]
MILEQIIFGNTIRNWTWFFVFIVFGVLVSWSIIFIIKNIFIKLTKITKNKIDDIVAKILSKPMPLKIIIVMIFFNIGFKFLNTSLGLKNFVKQATFVVVVLAIALFLIKFFIGLIEEYLEEYAKKSDSKYDDQLIPLLKSLVKIVFFLFAILVILSNLGYDVTALLAGLGIGGIAIAFAAKDILENLISGVTIFVEKPFKMGDTLKTSEGVGSVEEIGIRSTKIRTFDNTVVVIPNRLLSTNSVENISSRRARRENYTVGLTYNTSVTKIEKAQEIVKKILNKNKNVEQDTIVVGFESFGDYSLNIRIIYWIISLDYNEYVNTKNNINLTIKKEFEKEKIDFAFPTQTIEIKK